METPLLVTKFHAPPLRPETVSRSRLLEQLAGASTRKLTLVSAPAGFGKTTLLAAWRHTLHEPGRNTVGWLALERADSQPARFWTYFISALQVTAPTLATAALEMLRAAEQPPLEPILTVLLNAIQSCSQSLTLILDDYHLIESAAIQEGMTFLLEHLPPHCHLVIATRMDPPWPLARWRAQCSLLEVRQHELRFTPEEAAAFLHGAMRLDLSPEDITALDAHTEGWVAGLQMAALSLQRQSDTHGFITAFTHSDRYIFDYLLEEVLQQQSPEVQDFLLKTAILDRLSAPLCDALLQDDGRQLPGETIRILHTLETANLFLMPLDHERHWYRYHHLFARLLQAHGQKLGLDYTPYHLRASAWLETHGLPTAALGHALQAEDFAQAARIAEEHALVMLGQGHLGTLAAWLDTLPDTLTHTRPWLCLAQAWIAAYAARLEAAEHWLGRAESLLENTQPPDHCRISGHIAVIRAQTAGLGGDYARIPTLAEQALAALPSEDQTGRIMAYAMLGIALRRQAQFNAAERALEQAVTLAAGQPGNQVTLFAQCHWASLHRWRGELPRAAQEYRQIIQNAQAANVHASMLCLAYQALGHIAREQNLLDEALRWTRQGLTLAEQWGHSEFTLSGYVDLADLLLLTQDDPQEGLDTLARARQQRGEMAWPSWLEALEIEMQGRAGHTTAVCAWAHEFEGRDHAPPLSITHSAIYLMLARAWLSEKRWSEARILLLRVWDLIEPTPLVNRKLKTLVLLAQAYAGERNPHRAQTMLETALLLGEPGGYVRAFLDEGPALAALLQAVPFHSPSRKYARRLLAEYARTEAGKYPAQPAELLEPLTERELEILRLLATSMDSQAIAAQLVIAVSTVRTHIRNLYAKLGVKRRLEALQRGKELGLL